MILKEKFMSENEDKNYLLISPRMVQGGITLVNNYETLKLYESMDDNTIKFAEKKINNLVSTAISNDKEAKDYLTFQLIFCGDFDELSDDMCSFEEFINSYKERIVAVYRYVQKVKHKELFVGFSQSETTYDYGYIYLNLARLLEELDKASVEYQIDTDNNRFNLYKQDNSTKFIISYNPKCEMKDEQQLKMKN